MSTNRPNEKQGLLLINLGTPDSTETKDVRSYLKEFLSDPRVLDINPVGRWFLLNLFILPTRPKQSGAAYKTIWTDRGSPLKFHTIDLTDKVQAILGQQWHVQYAMRYQNPSIAKALKKFAEKGIDRITVLPLFPQYSSAAWGSAVEKVFEEASQFWTIPSISVIPPFFSHPKFIDSFTQIAERTMGDNSYERILFSFHGVPERHCTKTDLTGNHCLKSSTCCEQLVTANRNCYRAQCFVTARKLAAALHLPPDRWEVCFQSRLGRTPWIKPYFDVRLTELAEEGVKKILVFSPSFVADCLETIEEIGDRAVEQFTGEGGQELTLVPSLNAEDVWAEAVADMARSGSQHLPPEL